MNKPLEERVERQPISLRRTHAPRMVALYAISMVMPGCGDEDESCDTDKDCYNGQDAANKFDTYRVDRGQSVKEQYALGLSNLALSACYKRGGSR